MDPTPDCPYCHSHDARHLNEIVIGLAGYRCHGCAKVFYVASSDVTNQLQNAGTNRQPTADKPAA